MHATVQTQVNFFDQLKPKPSQANPWIFYDSTCGKPLFKAPAGRTFEEWKAESIRHGWPSFHDEESFLHNLKVNSRGEVKSVCGTHLGHNWPDTPVSTVTASTWFAWREEQAIKRPRLRPVVRFLWEVATARGVRSMNVSSTDGLRVV